jgi:hypothetical protein
MTAPPEITVSYSELAAFRDCPLKHLLEYKQRWARPEKEGTALAKGILWHQVMEAHYRSLKATAGEPGHASRLKLAKEKVMPYLHTQGGQSEDQALIQWMYEGYIQRWGVDPDWDILQVEDKRVVPLPNAEGADSRFSIKVKIDLIVRVRSTHRVWLVDHKSGKDLDREKDLDLDDQFGIYTWGMRQLGKPVHGFLYSGARTYKLKTKEQPIEERFKRIPLSRTDLELSNLAWDAYRAARAAYSTQNAQPYSSPNPNQCHWKCDFTEAHLLARKGVPIEQTLKASGFRQLDEKYQRIGKEHDGA